MAPVFIRYNHSAFADLTSHFYISPANKIDMVEGVKTSECRDYAG